MDTDLITMVDPNPDQWGVRYRRKEAIMAGDARYYMDNFGWIIDTDLITMVDPNPDQWGERFTRKEAIMAGDARYYMDERGWVIDSDYYTMVNPQNNYSIEEKIMAGDVHGWLAQGWAMSYDSIPVYSKVQGRSVYVRADAARTFAQQDAAQYTQIQIERRNQENVRSRQLASRSKSRSDAQQNWFNAGIYAEPFVGDEQGPFLAFGESAYGDTEGQKGNFGFGLGSVSGELVHAGGDYQYGGFGLGAIKGEASAVISTKDGVNISLQGSLVNGELYGKIPLPNDSSLKVGVEGYFGGVGVEVKINSNGVKIGVSAIVGGSIQIGIEN